jgi:hypothetical protein
MRSELRNWDSKITFFAFADIITAVSGMLIFITLLLATDLGQPTRDRAAAAIVESQIEETLARQQKADEQNARLESLLSNAQAAPDAGKLQTDIDRIRVELEDARKQQLALAERLAGSHAATQARDARLGLSDLAASVQRTLGEALAIGRRDGDARVAMAPLKAQVERLENTLVRLRQRDGQVWLIPDHNGTTKEPVLVTVGKAGATVERFNHPEQRKQWDGAAADSQFRAYLGKNDAAKQYVVFLIRPSGISLFQELLQAARGAGFEVGYDALEEDREIHFSTPPPIDEPETAKIPAVAGGASATSNPPAGNTASSGASRASAPTVQPAGVPAKAEPAPPPNPPPAKKSWWQRFLEWLGLA